MRGLYTGLATPRSRIQRCRLGQCCLGLHLLSGTTPVNWVDPTGMRPISLEEFEAFQAQNDKATFHKAWDAISEDPWGTLAMVAVTAVGVGLLFVPGGQVIGAGILIGVASTSAVGLATGNFNPRDVALGGAFGAIPGGSTVRGAALIGAGSGFAETTASSYLNGNGMPSGQDLVISTVSGGTFAAGGQAMSNLTPSNSTAAAAHTPDPPSTTPALGPGPQPVAAIGPAGNPGALPTSTAIELHPFSGGGTAITTTDRIAEHIDSPFIGHPTDMYIAPTNQIDNLLAGGPTRHDVEVNLGLGEGDLSGGSVVRVDVPDALDRNLRLPDPSTGNQFHRPNTGLTTGNLNEAVIESPLRTEVTTTVVGEL